MSECEYCHSILSSKIALKSHQKRAKYCIEQQKELNINIVITEFECEYCSKNFTHKEVKRRHESTCKLKDSTLLSNRLASLQIKIEEYKEGEEKLKNLIDSYENKIKELEIDNITLRSDLKTAITKSDIFEKLHTKNDNCIEKLALQPKITKSNSSSNTTVNNILNNMPNFNITLENLTQAAQEKYDIDLFLQGQVGAAKFILDYAKNLNNGIVPWAFTDKSRNVLNYKDENGEIIKDPKAMMLTLLVSDAIRELNKEHYDTIYKQNEKAYNSEDDLENTSDSETSGDIMENRADESLMSLKKLKIDNSVFRKTLIKGY